MNKLRAMQAEDIKAVVAVIDSHDDDDAEEALAGYQEIGGIEDQFVLEQNNQIIGVTGFATPPGCDQTYWLSWTYVQDNYANQGHGRIMLNELIQHLKDLGGRKLFVKVSDYVDEELGEEEGAIYAAALHLYKSLGFKLEITHQDYYDEGEAQLILGLRLKPSTNTNDDVAMEDCPINFNAVFEIAETDDAYSFGWHDEGKAMFDKSDVELGIEHAKKEDARAIFLSFPTNYNGVYKTLLDADFEFAGILDDYFEDGIHEQHFSYKF